MFEYTFFWYVDYDEIDLRKLISKKHFDDFVERSNNFIAHRCDFRKFLMPNFLDGT